MNFRNSSWIIFLAVLLAACTGSPATELTDNDLAPTLSIDPTPSVTREVAGEAAIEFLQVSYLETEPIQVAARITGYLPDSCTVIDQINVEYNEEVFEISLTTRLQADVGCIQESQPFDEEIILNTEELPIGLYAVKAGEHTVYFSLVDENGSIGG